MKRTLVFGSVFSLLIVSTSAFAEDVTLTTKGYVDTGLRAVYSVAKDAQDRVGVTEGKVGNLIGTTADHAVSISNLQTDVGNNAVAIGGLQETVGDSSAGLVKGVADNAAAIQLLQQTVQTADTSEYIGGEGIVIDNHVVNIKDLDKTKEYGNITKKYVYQNGVLTELEFVRIWNPSVQEQEIQEYTGQ